MTTESGTQIFEILRARGLLSASIQRSILAFMERWDVDAFRALIETNVVEESKMADIISDALRLPRVRQILRFNVQPAVLELIPYNVALDLVVLPFELSSDEAHLKVVFADPASVEKCEMVRSVTGKKITQFVGERTEIISAIQRHYPLKLQLPALLANSSGRNEESFK